MEAQRLALRAAIAAYAARTHPAPPPPLRAIERRAPDGGGASGSSGGDAAEVKGGEGGGGGGGPRAALAGRADDDPALAWSAGDRVTARNFCGFVRAQEGDERGLVDVRTTRAPTLTAP